MTEQQVREHKHGLKLVRHRRNLRSLAQRRRGTRAIREAIRQIKLALARIDRRLQAREISPWQMDGCATKKIWRHFHPDRWREYMLPRWKAKTYRRTTKGVMPDKWASADWLRTLKTFGGCCAYCGMTRSAARKAGHDLEVDHIVALSRGGRNVLMNLACACKTCNSSKSNGDLMAWATSIGRTPVPRAVARYAVIIAAMLPLNGGLDANVA